MSAIARSRTETSLVAYLDSHEGVVCLLIANGELASGHFVAISKRLQLLDSLGLENRGCELDVGLGVLVSRLAFCQSLSTSHVTRSFQPLTYTTVSSGNEARRLFKASCISAAVPSKNLPHPVRYQYCHLNHTAIGWRRCRCIPLMKSVSPVNTALSLPSSK